MRCLGGKRWEKLWIGWNWLFRVNLSLILGKKLGKHVKWPKLAIWSQSKPLFLAKFIVVGHFEPLQCEIIQKSWKTQKISQCTSSTTTIFEISPKMRCFGGKRWENLWIEWNWPFQINLSLILGEKMGKPAKWPKLAILRVTKPPFWQNLSLWFSFSSFSVTPFEKVEKLKTFADVPHPHGNENFWDCSKSEMLWWQKMEKVVNWVKLAIPNQSEPHIWEKRWENLQNDQNWQFWGNLGHLFGQNSPL